jgi:hypothetical protein
MKNPENLCTTVTNKRLMDYQNAHASMWNANASANVWLIGFARMDTHTPFPQPSSHRL